MGPRHGPTVSAFGVEGRATRKAWKQARLAASVVPWSPECFPKLRESLAFAPRAVCASMSIVMVLVLCRLHNTRALVVQFALARRDTSTERSLQALTAVPVALNANSAENKPIPSPSVKRLATGEFRHGGCNTERSKVTKGADG